MDFGSIFDRFSDGFDKIADTYVKVENARRASDFSGRGQHETFHKVERDTQTNLRPQAQNGSGFQMKTEYVIVGVAAVFTVFVLKS